MSRNKDNKKKSYKGLIILIDLISIGIVIACILMDTLWINNIEYELVSVSIDSFLALIAILSSFVIPYAENRTYQKYNLSNDDLNNIRGDTKIIYINLLVASIIMFAADAIFYMFDLALSLFGVIVVGLLFICVFVAPRIVEYAKGEDAVIETIRKKCYECMNKKEDSFNFGGFKAFHPIQLEASEKLIVSFILDKGFEEAYLLLIKNQKRKKKKDNVLSKDDLYIFLCSEQSKYMYSLPEDPDIDNVLNSKIVHQFMNNIFYLTSSAAINLIGDFKPHDKNMALLSVAQSLNLFYKLISNEEKYKKEFAEKATLMFTRTIDHTYGRFSDSSRNTLLFLNYLFVECTDEGGTWLIDILADIYNDMIEIRFSKSRIFIDLMFMQIFSMFFHQTYLGDSKKLYDYFIEKFKGCKGFLFIRNHNFFNSESFDNLYTIYKDCKKAIDEINSNFGENIYRFNSYYQIYNNCLPTYIVCLIPITHYLNIECTDDILFKLNEEQRAMVIEYSSFVSSGIRGYTDEALRFINCLKEISFLPNTFERNDLYNCMTYVSKYESRQEELNKIKRQIGFDLFLNDFNTYVKNHPCYDENPKRDVKKYPEHRNLLPYFRFSPFFVSKKAKLEDLEADASPLNISSYLNDLVKQHFAECVFNFSEIVNYDDALINSIKDFKPKYKNAPHFDSYCLKKKIHLDDCQDSRWFKIGRDDEIFVKEGAIKFNTNINNIFIRHISKDEAINCLKSIEHFKGQHLVLQTYNRIANRDSDSKEYSEEEIEKIKNEYYYVELDLNLFGSVVVDTDNILIFNYIGHANMKRSK